MHVPSQIIHRERYLNALKPFIDKRLIKVLTGQRRVGKSYLLFQLIQHIQQIKSNAPIIYINKEDLVFSHIKNAIDLNDYVSEKASKTETTYVFIDEIQDIEDFHVALRSLLLNEKLDIYCTGSNANLLSSDIAGNLSGRYVETVVYSLSYLEFLEFHQLEDGEDALEKYMKFGGLPYLKHLPLKDEIIFEYLKNIYSTIIYRDVVNRFNIRNTSFLEKLVQFLASNTGSLFSSKSISDYLKSQQLNVAPNQVHSYINHLVNAYIILACKRFNIHGKRLFEIGEKYYFENLGIRNAIWGYRLEDRGKIIENLVHNHLLYLNYTVNVGVLGAHEIDFIAKKNAEIVYIQVALMLKEENTLEREFGNLLKIKDNYQKFVVTLDNYSGSSYQGIEVIHLSKFLTSSLLNT
jgi:predicted AAA+ superfamily ATPase